MPATDSDIQQAVNILSDLLGSREDLLVTILEILKDEGEITEDQQLRILRRILTLTAETKKYNKKMGGLLLLS